ncbi:carbon-nitrogen hydrolase family protein [Selenihalanaerobacter shriftii]|uniref:Predicted amidohydrolase n=1 Tax=Selenihalanaerobacter shriftii TaxID=142842 RepID=A0A1T4K947_9FIRM|nr:carbon-nitrogen hydrolase family protein [Selenihalanaerobacter shriftii]SJZ38926.1 Predicted amidohydrolase [Selenihalanaerobacter shriftii]
MNKKLKLAVCQNKVIADKDKNLLKMKKMIAKAVKQGVELIILPEMFNCPYDNHYFPIYSEEIPGGKTYEFLSKQAKEHNIYLIGGSIPETVVEDKDEKLYNTSLIFGPDGKLLDKHRKIHLFDVDLSDGVTFLESNTLSYGEKVTVVETELINIGVAICYDLRFPELMRLMVDKGAEMIIIPGAFNTVTGPAHWETLLKARAVDNQVFVVGASPARNLEADYHAYGHSMIIDPWAEKLHEAGSKEDVIIQEIDLTKLEKIREELPLLKHRRSDLYKLEEI